MDNWLGFFRKLPYCFARDIFVWAFWGGRNHPKIARCACLHRVCFVVLTWRFCSDCRAYLSLKSDKHVRFTKCGIRKGAPLFTSVLSGLC